MCRIKNYNSIYTVWTKQLLPSVLIYSNLRRYNNLNSPSPCSHSYDRNVFSVISVYLVALSLPKGNWALLQMTSGITL